MHHLAQLGLYEAQTATRDPKEERTELRLIVEQKFVAWFQANTRESDGESIVGAHFQFVRRDGLTDEQIAAVTNWLRDQIQAQFVDTRPAHTAVAA